MTRRQLSATTAQPSTTPTTGFAATSATGPAAAPTTATTPTTESAAPTTARAPTTAAETTEFGSGPCYTDDDGAMSTDAGDHAVPESADESTLGQGDSA